MIYCSLMKEFCERNASITHLNYNQLNDVEAVAFITNIRHTPFIRAGFSLLARKFMCVFDFIE